MEDYIDKTFKSVTDFTKVYVVVMTFFIYVGEFSTHTIQS